MVVLTPQEKAAACCVVGAFILGIATQQYRAHHPRAVVARTMREQRAKKPSTKFQRNGVTPTPTAEEPDEDDD
ncbi:MAG: hypothetical protein M3Y69_07610 [Verrucomicrobiota bacterium]|nr:hypothetical protein [Verrucomicrobiota bacterium]